MKLSKIIYAKNNIKTENVIKFPKIPPGRVVLFF